MAWWDQLDGPILGRYRIERLLGEGGMARVFLATDVRADRPVAFKTPKLESFPPDSAKELLSRFNREFRSQASDPIQGVIPIYESGEFTDAEGVVRPFLAMQYLSGGSLGDALGGSIGARAHTQTLAEVLDWLVPIARTVDRLHARKYLHRDIKPDNILFNSDGDPFLADLGIVGSLDNTLGGSTMASTALGVLGSPGSPGYQSPESIRADPALRNVSASDQFSLAVTVYEALSGKLPVAAGTNQEWYGALMHWSPTPLITQCPDMPAAASDAVMKAMSTQASGRFTSCSEFAKAIAAAVQAPRVAPVPPAPSESAAANPPPRTSAPPAPRAPAAAAANPSARKPMSSSTRAVLAAAVVLAAVLSVGWKLGWMDGRTESDGVPVGPGIGGHTPPTPPDEDGAHAGDAPPVAATAWTALFDFDKIAPTVDSRLILDDAAAFLRRTPDARLLIIGHADPTEGSAAYAMGVSQRRADSVREYLVLNGIDGARLRTEARGGTQPLAPSVQGDGSTDRAVVARNRRVELVLDTTPAASDAAPAPASDAGVSTAAAPAPAGPMTFALAKARGVQCQDFDFDHDSVADCWDNCQELLEPTDFVDDKGCPRPFTATFRVLAFGAGQASLTAASKRSLDAAFRDLVKDNRLTYRLLGRADQSEGSAAQKQSLSERRARAAFDYLVTKGVPAVRLKASGEGDLASVGSARDPRVIATQRIVVLQGERGAEQPIPLVPLDAANIPQLQAAPAVVPRWTVCRAEVPGADGKTLFYSITEPMDVGPIPDWQDRLRNDGPHRSSMRAAGASEFNREFISCTALAGDPGEAKRRDTKRTITFLEEQGRVWTLQRVNGEWTIRGAREP